MRFRAGIGRKSSYGACMHIRIRFLAGLLIPAIFGGCAEDPQAFRLLSPDDGAQAVSLTPILRWSDTSREIRYRVQIATDAEFQALVYENVDLLPGTTELAVPAGVLTSGISYFWRVSAAGSYRRWWWPDNGPFSFTPYAWARSYGGSSNDWFQSVLATSDGGSVTAGVTESFGAGLADLGVAKLTRTGEVIWHKAYGGGVPDRGGSIQATADGGYVMAGHTRSFSSSYDFWVLTLSAEGVPLLQKAFGGAGFEVAYSIRPTQDGGYWVGGWTNSFGAGGYDFWIVRLHSDGTLARQKTLGGAGQDLLYSMETTSDDGCIVTGATRSFGAGDYDFWILKLRSDDSVEWQKTFGGSSEDIPASLRKTSNGGFVVAGSTLSFGAGSHDAWVMELNAAGEVVWQKTYGGTEEDRAEHIQPTRDGGYLVTGRTKSFRASGYDCWLMKLDATGQLLWQNRYGGAADEIAWSAREIPEEGFLLVGQTSTFGAGGMDGWVLKVDRDGSLPSWAIPTDAETSDTNASVSIPIPVEVRTTVSSFDTTVMVTDVSATIQTQAP